VEDLDAVDTGLRERNCVVAPPRCPVRLGLGAEIMVELLLQLCLLECEVTQGFRRYPRDGVRVRLRYYNRGEVQSGL
jgi:hypothetical protein